MCTRVLTGSLHPWALQLSCPEQQLLSVHWMQSALSLTHCLIHFDWPAFLLRGKDRTERGWPLMSRDQPFPFHTTSNWMHIHNVLVWMEKNRHGGRSRVERTGNAFDCWRQHICCHLVYHKCNWLSQTFTRGKISITEIILLETGDIPSSPNQQTVLYPSKGCIQASRPPSLCRWRCHMWQLWSKQGVELPACWDSALFASYRQTRSKPLRPSSQQNSIVFSPWEEPLCSGHAVPFQHHGQRSCTAGERWKQFQHHLFWTAPTVHIVKMTKDQTGRQALEMKAKIMRHTASLQSPTKEEMIEDIALFVKIIHMVIR